MRLESYEIRVFFFSFTECVIFVENHHSTRKYSILLEIISAFWQRKK